MPTSRNPYHQDGQPPLVLPSVVVYMDVLGYTEMAMRAELEARQNPFLAQLYQALHTGQKWLRDDDTNLPVIGEQDFYAMKAFTDNIVIGWPVGKYRRDDGEVELGLAFIKLAAFQLEMANAGFFVRGAISLGDAYIDDIAVFGGAFMEAHDGESRLARDPRVILTKSAAETVRKHLTYYHEPKQSPQNRALYHDSDGQWFLNYLDTVFLAEDEGGVAYHELVRHKEIVEKRLGEFRSEPRIWSKYAWVANYHNYFCDQYPQHFDDSHKINWSAAQVRPARIVTGGD